MLSQKMTIGNLEVEGDKRCDAFADFFEAKVKSITDNTKVDETVFNGIQKIAAEDSVISVN